MKKAIFACVIFLLSIFFIEKSTSGHLGKNYNFGIISSVTVILYTISYTAVKLNKLALLTHRKIWNMLLGTHFFITALLGLLLVLRISYGFVLPLPFNILFFHVEAGIIFALIAVFHIIWHWPYFKSIIQKRPIKQI